MGEKIRFFPLDAAYKIIDGKAVIHLFGRTEDGRQICILDENFQPYFYAIPKQNANAKEKIEKLAVERDNETYSVTKAEIVEKTYLGKEIEAIKVFTKLPRDVPVIRDIIREWELIESINEYDILFTRRYLIDKNITPMTLYEAEGEFANLSLKVPGFKAEKIGQVGNITLANPKILAIDIETYTPSNRAIEPEKNPIIMAALHGDDFQKVVTWKKFKTGLDYIEFVNSEAELIKYIKDHIEAYKPDILTGYFSDGFDLPYIKARADKYRIKLDLGLDFSELRIKKGYNIAVQINGITHLDIFKFIRKIMGPSMDTGTYNLNAVAAELLGEQKHDVDLDQLSHTWDNNAEDLERYCKYNMHDALLCFKLAEKMLPTITELVKIVGLPIFDINRMGFSQLVEWFVLRQAPLFNEIAPNKPSYNEIEKRRLQSIKGAFVFEPRPGLYNDIVVFDYRSLYPTIIASHNISPGTLNCECCEGKAEKVPLENQNFWFCAKRKGFLPRIIEDIITRRARIKEMVKEGKEKNVFLEARSNALKLLANSFYGYLGFFGARYYSIESAESTTAFGRFYIKMVIEKAQQSGFKVLYSDTDSVFLTLDGKTKNEVEKFAEKINSELPGLMELEYQGFYPSGIFVSAKFGPYGAKKKYALLSEDGSLKIKGFETVRRNWSFIAKDVQENVLNIILREHDEKKALEFVKNVVHDLRERKIPLDKVVIHTQLQKEIFDYDSRGPHVAVAQRLKNQGVPVGPGTMIKYVVTSGSDIIRNRSKLPEEVKDHDYDPVYYIENQVVPAVEKIFGVLGYSKEDLLEHREQKKLEGFFN